MRRLIVSMCLGVLPLVPLGAADVLTGVIDPYLRIQSALTTDSLDAVSDEAKIIVTEAGRMGPTARTVEEAAKELATAADIKAARASFGRLTEAILGYAQTSGSEVGADVKLAYCPMAKKSWLQKGEKVRNPYYGQEMLDCGEFKAKPAAKKSGA